MTTGELLAFISAHRYAVLSSTSSQGAPQSAVVGIAAGPHLEIVFDTLKTSRKYANLTARPACSLVVWTGEATAQYEGLAFEPTGGDGERYREIYFRAWPDGRDRMNWPGITHIAVRPTWIRYSDFNSKPNLIEEFDSSLLP